MPYYQGDYYRGDYYQGGIFDVFKKVGGALLGNVPIVGQVYRGVSTAKRLLGGGQPQAGTQPRPTIPVMQPPWQAAGGRGAVVGKPGQPYKDVYAMPRRRRRMNVTNDKALRRAIRRTQGFVKLAKKALKGTGYTVVSRGSTRKRHVIKESGPGGVVVQ